MRVTQSKNQTVVRSVLEDVAGVVPVDIVLALVHKGEVALYLPADKEGYDRDSKELPPRPKPLFYLVKYFSHSNS